MRNTSWKLAWVACLISTMAFGDGPPPPERGLYLGPEVGTSLVSFAWAGRSSYGTGLTPGFAPGVRTSLFLPYFAVGADLGLSGALGPFGGDQFGSLNLSGEVMPYLMKSGSTRAYGLAGLNLGVELAAQYARPQFLYPKMGFTLGVGLQHSLTSNFTISAEAGAQTQLLFGLYRLEPSTSLFVSFLSQWDLFASPQPREKVTGGGGVPGPACGPTSPPQNSQAPQAPLAPPSQPATYGRSTTSCTAYATDGWFEPTQGVWQDDPSFDDKKGKQLTRLPGDAIAYEAELKMVKNRDTLLFGVHHYRKGGELVPVNNRNNIVLMGLSNCTAQVPVKLKFTRTNPVETREIYTSPVIGQIPLDGPPSSEFKPWTAMLPVPSGIPPDKPFQLDVELSFQLKAELIRENGAPTGLQMTVDGYPEPAVGPKVHFVPVVVSLATNAEGVKLYDDTERLAVNSSRSIPDVFPLPPDGLPTFVKPIAHYDGLEIPAQWGAARRSDALAAALNDDLAASTFLDGAGRVVAVLRESDYKAIFGEDGSAAHTVPASFTPEPRAGETERWKQGHSLSGKVIVVPSSTAQWDTVAHELVHTLPEGWSGGEMQSACGRDYHNKKDPVAHGVKIDDQGTPAVSRETKGLTISLMGPEAAPSKTWITQCTYWHLLDQLGGVPPDPPVVLLRAWIGKEGAGVKGELKPVYNLMGHADLAAGRSGPFAFVLKDAKGVEMARYPFTPRWNDIETKKPRELISVVYRAPDLPGWKEVELVGPAGVLDRKTVTDRAPELVITAPADSSQVAAKDGKIHVTWQATSSGAPLLYSVQYSSDGGYNWVGQSFEQKGTAFDLKVDPKGTEHQVKIVVTDGTRSVEAVTRFTPMGL